MGGSDLMAITRGRSDWRRAMAVQEIGIRSEGDFQPVLMRLIEDDSPAIRRHAAMAASRKGDPAAAPVLLNRARLERVDMVRFSLAAAAVACGADPTEAGAVLLQAAGRTLVGAYGRRGTAGCAGYDSDTTAALWAIWVDGDEATLDFSRARALAREVPGFEADNRSAVIALSLHADPRDVPLLKGLWAGAGRRMRLTLVMAMGLHGDPRWLAPLRDVLLAMDVDPGHGFALRSEAATALGRLGLDAAVPYLVRALTNEALDHEGRPGAGLGIQRSVRTHILGALGELGGSSAVLADYLGNTHGSAEGGFYLAAMDGLWKAGSADPLYGLLDAEAVVAANALGVLGALLGPQSVVPWLEDSRPLVRSVALAYSEGDVIDEL